MVYSLVNCFRGSIGLTTGDVVHFLCFSICQGGERLHFVHAFADQHLDVLLDMLSLLIEAFKRISILRLRVCDLEASRDFCLLCFKVANFELFVDV